MSFVASSCEAADDDGATPVSRDDEAGGIVDASYARVARVVRTTAIPIHAALRAVCTARRYHATPRP
jgi:hypothetical protein